MSEGRVLEVMLEIKNLQKSYGDVKALAGVDVQLDMGIYGILGPNGSGKSTLMNILTDNVKRDSGDILWDGKEVLALGEEYRRRVGYMPQEQICYPQFSLQEFLNYMAVLKGMDTKSAAVKEQIDELLCELNLADVRKRRIATFSGGMKRRAVLAQALLGTPELLILDEPTAGLDPKERISIRNMIARMAKDKTVILATHIAGDIECIADRVLLLKKGRVIQNAGPFELMEGISGHVRELKCSREELEELQKTYRVSNCIQKKNGLSLHVIEKECKEQTEAEEAEVTLDDVYLYYFEVNEEE